MAKYCISCNRLLTSGYCSFCSFRSPKALSNVPKPSAYTIINPMLTPSPPKPPQSPQLHPQFGTPFFNGQTPVHTGVDPRTDQKAFAKRLYEGPPPKIAQCEMCQKNILVCNCPK
jgi:hypothetical protein